MASLCNGSKASFDVSCQMMFLVAPNTCKYIYCFSLLSHWPHPQKGPMSGFAMKPLKPRIQSHGHSLEESLTKSGGAVVTMIST